MAIDELLGYTKQAVYIKSLCPFFEIIYQNILIIFLLKSDKKVISDTQIVTKYRWITRE